jgi:hypothetical protein
MGAKPLYSTSQVRIYVVGEFVFKRRYSSK